MKPYCIPACLILAFMIIGCTSDNVPVETGGLDIPYIDGDDTSSVSIDTAIAVDSFLVDYFVDSTHLGYRGEYRIGIEHREDSSHHGYYVVMEFERRVGDHWASLQKLNLKKEGLSPLRPQFTDHNNDGYDDLTLIEVNSNQDSVGVHSMWLFDKEGDTLRKQDPS